MKKSELKEILKELISEMWVGIGNSSDDGSNTDMDKLKPTGRLTEPGSDAPFVDLYKGGKSTTGTLPSVGGAMSESYPGDTWNPRSLIKTKDEITNLIFQLKEGTVITFLYDKLSRSSYWEAVEKTVEGDEYVYKYFGQGNGKHKIYLESDEEVRKYADNISKDKNLNYYVIHDVVDNQGKRYKRKQHQGDPDHDIGDYEMNGPDRPNWRELYEAKGMNTKNKLKNIIQEVIKEITDEDHDWEESQELLVMKRIQSYAHWGKINLQKHPNEIQGIFDKIVQEIDGLISAHEKRKSVKKQQFLKRKLQYKHGRPVDGIYGQ